MGIFKAATVSRLSHKLRIIAGLGADMCLSSWNSNELEVGE